MKNQKSQRIEIAALAQDELDKFSEFADKHQVRAETDKGVKIGEEWFPKSQMRKDSAGNLYLADWLLEKRQEEKAAEDDPTWHRAPAPEDAYNFNREDDDMPF